MLIGFTLISFATSIYSVYTNPKFAFYFPICRFWQMAIGGLIAYQNTKIDSKFIINFISLGSIFAITFILWKVNEDSLFPGWWALIPSLGTCFIILAGQ